MSGVRRLQAKIYGRVQGVGYRYFVHRTARQHKLTGYVMNRPDGSVLVEAQGTEAQLQELLQELRFGPSLATVEDLRVEWLDPVKNEKSFDIRFW